MKFRITPVVGSWRLDTWGNVDSFGDPVDKEGWRFKSYHSYKWQAKRCAKHLATKEEIFTL